MRQSQWCKTSSCAAGARSRGGGGGYRTFVSSSASFPERNVSLHEKVKMMGVPGRRSPVGIKLILRHEIGHSQTGCTNSPLHFIPCGGKMNCVGDPGTRLPPCEPNERTCTLSGRDTLARTTVTYTQF